VAEPLQRWLTSLSLSPGQPASARPVLQIMARALLPCRRSGRRRCCGWRCALALCLLLACACALVRYIPWDHGQRIYIGRSLLPGLSLHRDDCPATRFGMLQLLTSWLAAHKVPYFLTYGSLLGAVREGRIISYTPDLDIAIPALWTDRVQHLFQTELPDCFETGLNGAVADGVNRQVFHIYTRSPTPERMHAASPLLPFLRYAHIICCSSSCDQNPGRH
jgi:hypothetical protein